MNLDVDIVADGHRLGGRHDAELRVRQRRDVHLAVHSHAALRNRVGRRQDHTREIQDAGPSGERLERDRRQRLRATGRAGGRRRDLAVADGTGRDRGAELRDRAQVGAADQALVGQLGRVEGQLELERPGVEHVVGDHVHREGITDHHILDGRHDPHVGRRGIHRHAAVGGSKRDAAEVRALGGAKVRGEVPAATAWKVMVASTPEPSLPAPEAERSKGHRARRSA